MLTKPACLLKRVVTSIARSILHWLEWLFWMSVFLVASSGQERSGRSSGYQANTMCQQKAKLPREGAVMTSEGGSTDYYRLPDGATELMDLIEHRRMSFALGNIFKACYRFGEKDTASRLYDINKIIYFAERLKAQELKRQQAGK